jgi:hypothetical protein
MGADHYDYASPSIWILIRYVKAAKMLGMIWGRSSSLGSD